MSVKRLLYLASNYTSCVDVGQIREAEDIEREFAQLLNEFVEKKVLEILRQRPSTN